MRIFYLKCVKGNGNFCQNKQEPAVPRRGTGRQTKSPDLNQSRQGLLVRADGTLGAPIQVAESTLSRRDLDLFEQPRSCAGRTHGRGRIPPKQRSGRRNARRGPARRWKENASRGLDSTRYRHIAQAASPARIFPPTTGTPSIQPCSNWGTTTLEVCARPVGR